MRGPVSTETLPLGTVVHELRDVWCSAPCTTSPDAPRADLHADRARGDGVAGGARRRARPWPMRRRPKGLAPLACRTDKIDARVPAELS